MSARHLVVDGSNIATEGRSIPSLAALESAVEELRREVPATEVIVVVDATFAHRIEASERERFEEAALRGDFVYPPAGAIGRGDAFLLRIAEKIGAAVLSNDSFQEFHGEHPWLFDTGRLLGATPVPGVGWIFVPRIPVRGPKSRLAVRESKQSKGKVERAIAAATKEAVEPDKPAKGGKDRKAGRGKSGKGPAGHPDEHSGERRSPAAVNEPLTFISFVADHPLGDVLEATVDSFTSHGAIVAVGEMRCYVPLSGLGDPPPRSAREILKKGERREFVLTALDPQRRGVELALPEAAVVSGKPQPETVEAEVAMAKPRRTRKSKEVAKVAPADEIRAEAVASPKRTRVVKKVGKEPAAVTRVAQVTAAEPPAAPVRRSRAAARKAAAVAPEPVLPGRATKTAAAPGAARKKAAAKVAAKAPAKKVAQPAKKAAAAKKAAPSKKAVPVKRAARSNTAKSAPAPETTSGPAAAKKATRRTAKS